MTTFGAELGGPFHEPGTKAAWHSYLDHRLSALSLPLAPANYVNATAADFRLDRIQRGSHVREGSTVDAEATFQHRQSGKALRLRSPEHGGLDMSEWGVGALGPAELHPYPPIEWVRPALGHRKRGQVRNPSARELLALWLEDACPPWLRSVLDDTFEKPRQYRWQRPDPKILASLAIEHDAWHALITGVDPQTSRVLKSRKRQLAFALERLKFCAMTRPEHGWREFDEAAWLPQPRYSDNLFPTRHQVESLLLQRRRLFFSAGNRHRDAWRPLNIDEGDCDLLRRVVIELVHLTDFFQAIDLHEAISLARAMALLACDFTTHSALDVREIAYGLSLFSVAQWASAVRLPPRKKVPFLERLDQWFWSYRGLGAKTCETAPSPAEAEISFIWPDSPPEFDGADLSVITALHFPERAIEVVEDIGTEPESTNSSTLAIAHVSDTGRSIQPLPGTIPDLENPGWRPIAPHPWLPPSPLTSATLFEERAADPLQRLRDYFGPAHGEVERLLKTHSNNRDVYLALKAAGGAFSSWLDHLYGKLDLFPGCVKASDLASNELEPYRFALEGGRLIRTTGALDRLLSNTLLKGASRTATTAPWPLPPLYVHFDTPLVAVYGESHWRRACVDTIRIAGAYVRPHPKRSSAFWIAPTVCVAPTQCQRVESFTTAFLDYVGASDWQLPDLDACGSAFDRAVLATVVHLSKVFCYWACEGAEYCTQSLDPALRAGHCAQESRIVGLGNEILIGPPGIAAPAHYGLGHLGSDADNESGLWRWDSPRVQKRPRKSLLEELVLTAAPAALVLPSGPGVL
jgi:hypothetical protein